MDQGSRVTPRVVEIYSENFVVINSGGHPVTVNWKEPVTCVSPKLLVFTLISNTCVMTNACADLSLSLSQTHTSSFQDLSLSLSLSLSHTHTHTHTHTHVVFKTSVCVCLSLTHTHTQFLKDPSLSRTRAHSPPPPPLSLSPSPASVLCRKSPVLVFDSLVSLQIHAQT